MSLIWIFLSMFTDSRAAGLRQAIVSLPDVRPDVVEPAVQGALLAETDRVPAELIIAISWGETRLIATTVTGSACGPMSSIRRNRRQCNAVLNYTDGYRAGVEELESHLRDRRIRGNIRLALLYFACGNSAFDGTCKKKQWPGWVLRRAQYIQEHESKYVRSH